MVGSCALGRAMCGDTKVRISWSMGSGVWGREVWGGTEKEQCENSELTELIPPDGGRAG